MNINLPWSRQQIVALASLTRVEGLYQALGEQAAVTTQMCTGALRERALAYGGRIYPCLSHQVLVVFGSPRKALDWIEQAPTLLMPILAGNSGAARPGLVIGFDCADTSELEGMLHSTAVSRVERLLWGRSDEIVFANAAASVIPDEVKGRVVRVAAPRDLGSVWRIGVKETAVMASSAATQPARLTPNSSGGTTSSAADGPRPVLRLEMLDRQIELGALDAPMIFGRSVSEGMEIPDPRVSRLHARIEPRGNQFAVVDSSSNGTWVQFDGHPNPVELRQQECVLHGRGMITFGVDPSDFSAPTVRFAVTMPSGFRGSGYGNTGFGASGFGATTRSANLTNS
jgi:adenylate cyclase